MASTRRVAEAKAKEFAAKRYEELAQQKERADQAKTLAEEALANSQYDDAIENVEIARAELQTYVKNKKPTGATKAQCEKEERRLNEIEFQVEEHKRRLELERQQREEHKALAHGLKALVHDMLGADSCSGLDVSRMFDAIRARHDQVLLEKSECRAQMDALRASQREAERKWGEEKRGLETQLQKVKQEIAESNKALDSAAASASAADAAASAISNFERFHSLPTGSASIDQVQRSCAGIRGWANARF